MKTDKGKPRPSLGRRAAAAIIFVSIAVNLVLIGRMLWTKERAVATSDVSLQEGDALAGEAPSSLPVESSEDARIPEGGAAAAGQPGPGVENPAAAKPGYGRRTDEAARRYAATAGIDAGGQNVERGGATGSEGNTGPASRPASAASAVGPPSRPQGAARPATSGSPAGGPGIPSVAASRGSARTPEDAAATAVKPAVESDPASDRSPPVLQSLGFSPPEVADGGVTTLVAQASDDLSGVKLVWGVLRSPSGAANLQFGPQAQGDNGQTVFKIPIGAEAETGVWYVSTLSLTDQAGNSAIQSFTTATVPPGGTLRVVSAESDSTAPEVLRIWVEKPSVEGGETNRVEIEARDDRSGVASIMGYFESPGKAAQLWFNCVPKANEDVCVGELRIPATADCGEWTLQFVKSTDKAGNVAYLPKNSPLMADAAFQVSGGTECDSSPPALDAFSLSSSVVSNETASEILVTAAVSDVGSGAISMTGWFEGPVATSGQAPRNYFSCTPDRNDPSAPWTGKIVVPQFAARGTWKVGLITLQDKARNTRQYTSADPVVAGSIFEVQ
jgi:hypothetical protein